MLDAHTLIGGVMGISDTVSSLFQVEFDGFGIHPISFGVGDVDVEERPPVDAKESFSIHGHGTDMGPEFILASFRDLYRVSE